MVAPTITTADTAANIQGQSNTANSISSSYTSGVDSGINFVNYLTANMGAAAVETAYAVGGDSPANIVAAAVNGSYSASSAGYSGSSYLTGGSSSTSGGSYVTSGSSSYAESSSVDYETQLATMQQNQAELMMVQFQVGDMQTTTQMTSNIENIRQSTLVKIIQNMKG